MALFDDEPRRPTAAHVVGQDIARLSIADLEARIDELTAEIDRLKSEIGRRGDTKDAAEALFRR